MTGEEKPSGTCGIVHLPCVAVTSPRPVGSTATPGPPRPLSQYTRPPPYTGDGVSPVRLPVLHVQITSPLSGSSPCTAVAPATSNCGLPLTVATTGVLCVQSASGRFFSQTRPPVLRSNASSADDFFCTSCSHISNTVSRYSTG